MAFPQGNIRRAGIRSPIKRIGSFRGFGQYSAGDYSTDMWKGSIYESSPINTSTNWLGSTVNLLTNVAKVATVVVPSILNYSVAKSAASDQKKIEQARLANETLVAQKQAAYYDQALAQSKANAAAVQNQQTGVVPYTPTVTGEGYIPSPAMEYITSASGGRGTMYGEYAVQPTIQLEDLKKYLPYIGFGIISLILLLRRPAPQVEQSR